MRVHLTQSLVFTSKIFIGTTSGQTPRFRYSFDVKMRTRVLAFVMAIAALFLFGTALSLYKISEVSKVLDAVNQISVPMNRLLAQLRVDADVFKREAERNLGYAHWREENWKPKPIPEWLSEMLRQETKKVSELLGSDKPWSTEGERKNWIRWSNDLREHTESLEKQSVELFQAISSGDETVMMKLYPSWITSLENWYRKIDWGTSEFERGLRQTFLTADNQVRDLRSALQILLVVVLCLSLLVVWIGEKTLRPLASLTLLVRGIAERGLRKEDKQELPPIPLTGKGEVSELTREFHRMATTLLEREKTVELQKERLAEQNMQLSQIGTLNRNILHSIRSVIMVTDWNGKIQQCNPGAYHFLGIAADENSHPVVGSAFSDWSKLSPLNEQLKTLKKTRAAVRIDAIQLGGRLYGGQLVALEPESGSKSSVLSDGPDNQPASEPLGAILVLEDRTDSVDLERRLQIAENLAAIGRMSAQVAHEVRNPLHSIGLEAELALEQMETQAHALESTASSGNSAIAGHSSSSGGGFALKQSLQSILASVDRLEHITENYLRLSRVSSGKKSRINLMESLESVLALYAQHCEKNQVTVDWLRESTGSLDVWVDQLSLEQVLGNLFQNAIQAVVESGQAQPRIEWRLGSLESGRAWIRIEDNGPGVPEELENRLFTPFWTTRAGGTGLGLSFVRKVLEDQGGSIRYERSARLKGAAFEVILPAPEAEKTSHQNEVTHG